MTHNDKLKENGLRCYCEGCNKEYFDFLHALREMGTINMFGAGAPLRMAYPELTQEESYKILNLWIASFKNKNS